jgi:hypothetical protein
MQQGIPTEETVLEYFRTLSNWGRWGVEDQLGTLNFLTPGKDPARRGPGARGRDDQLCAHHSL